MAQEDKSEEFIFLDKDADILIIQEVYAKPLSAEGDVIVSGDGKAFTDLDDGDADAGAEDSENLEGTESFVECPQESDAEESVKNEEQSSPKLTKIKVRTVTKQYCSNANFMKRVWKAFFTLNLFVIPMLFGLMFAILLNDADTWIKDDYYIDLTHHIMVAFLGTAMAVGLPFHLMALDELEETVLQARTNKQVTSKTTTRTTYYYDTGEVVTLEETCV